MSAIRYEKDADQIVTLTIDMPGQSANTMNADYRAAMQETTARLLAEAKEISGIVIASAKDTFFAGGDLKELIQAQPENAQEFFTMVESLKAQLRLIETLGVPVAAAINGAALGGGWEIALACHHRVCLNSPKVKIGLPEVTLGLLPGGGGVVRMVRLLGLEKALPLLMEGKQLRPDKALAMGLVHELVETRDELVPRAKAWIKANPKAKQPWDEKGYKLPGGAPSNPRVAQVLAVAPAMLLQKTRGCYPAPKAIMSAAVEGAQVDFDTATRIESRYFTQLATGQVAKNMIGTFWFQLNEIKAGGSRPADVPKAEFSKVGVLGAGMMGAGIAYAAATRGIDVVLKDVSQENDEKGKAYSEKLLAKQVSRGQKKESQKNDILARIQPTADAADLAGCDIIIEAVFENRELKAKVTQEAEAQAAPGALISSNTSTLPITGLAEASAKPENFIGLHFFSPVDKMPLVEIIRGAQTSDETLARAFDFVLQIDKTPIVVNDSRGFFTSRVFGTMVNEGIGMLAEGVLAALLEQAAAQAGFPVGPLALADEVSMGLMLHIRNQTKADFAAEGKSWDAHPAEAIVDEMVDEYKREGKAKGGGFYEYPKNGSKFLWPQLVERWTKADAGVSLEEARDRLLFIKAVETARCMQENVLESVRDANIGSIFGIGFPPWTGGALQFINQYGLPQFVTRARQLEEKYGPRFAPPQSLIDMAAAGETFRD